MTDLHARFRALDALEPPHLWGEIESRAAATERLPDRRFSLALIVATVLLTVSIWAMASIGLGGGVVPIQPVIPVGSASPSATPSAMPSQGAAPAWTAAGSMIEARHSHTATLLHDGTVLVAGGLVTDTGLASVELYHPRTGLWTTTGSMITGRGLHEAMLLEDGRVLVTGGISFAGGPDADIVLASSELYDPRTGSWSATGSMAEARAGGAATVLPDGRVLVAGGWGSGERFGPKLASAELYDPGTGTWTATGSMTEGRHGHSATLLSNGIVLVAGGYRESGRLASADLYDPPTGTWTATGSLPEPFLGYTNTLLANGTVLIAGGDVPSGPGAIGSAHAAVYDPATGTWTATGSLITARLGHAGTLLSDGRVLVSGGGNGGLESTTFATAELYDPGTGMWTASADLIRSRGGHTATLLPDGRVLVAGGLAPGGSLAYAELYGR